MESMDPHSGVGAGTPSPTKLRPEILRIDPARLVVTCTIMGAKALGSTYFHIIRPSDAPVARAASTYSVSRTVITDDLVTLANAAIFPRAIANTSTVILFPKAATMDIPRRRFGTAIKISTIRIRTLSRIPPKYPARVPRVTPIAQAIPTDVSPIVREVRHPQTILVYISLPSSSVPRKCSAEGPAYRFARSWIV